MSKDLVFVDVETTGLDPHEHTIVEAALVKGESTLTAWIDPESDELERASSIALQVNKFYTRYVNHDKVPIGPTERNVLALEICRMTDGCVLAGNNVKFDQQFLEAWLRRNGTCPTWDYHVLDVPVFTAGVLVSQGKDIQPPFKARKVSEPLGVEEPKDERAHTALADALWSKSIWERTLALCPPGNG